MTNIVFLACAPSSFTEGAAPVEVGICYGDVLRGFLVKPERDWDLTPEAEALNSISRIELESVGTPALKVADEINDFCSSLEVWCDSDLSKLAVLKLFADTGIKRDFELKSICEVLEEKILRRVQRATIGRRESAKEDAYELSVAYQNAIKGSPLFAA